MKQQCAGEANRLMALQMEIDELQVAFSDAFGSTIRQLDSQLHDRYGLTQVARAFVRDKFINSVFGVQRRYVQALVLADPQLSSNELGTKLEQLNGLPLDKRISTASSLGSAHVPPVERILGHKSVTLPGGRQVNVPCTTIEFPVTTLMQRFHEWDSSAWDETVQSLQRVYKAFVDRHEQKSFDITDILEGPVVGNEAVTLAFVEAAAKRGGVCDALGNCLLKEEDPCVKYIMHYFDGCGTDPVKYHYSRKLHRLCAACHRLGQFWHFVMQGTDEHISRVFSARLRWRIEPFLRPVHTTAMLRSHHVVAIGYRTDRRALMQSGPASTRPKLTHAYGKLASPSDRLTELILT